VLDRIEEEDLEDSIGKQIKNKHSDSKMKNEMKDLMAQIGQATSVVEKIEAAQSQRSHK